MKRRNLSSIVRSCLSRGSATGAKAGRISRRVLTIVLLVAVASAGCAVRARSAPAGPDTHGTAGIPRSYAAQLPVGRTVEVRLRSGGRFQATYMGVEGEAVRLQRTGRLPVPPELVPLTDVSVLRLAEKNGSPARAVLIGVVSGAAAFFGLLIGSLAAWAD